jgi:hypothetical protein
MGSRASMGLSPIPTTRPEREGICRLLFLTSGRRGPMPTEALLHIEDATPPLRRRLLYPKALYRRIRRRRRVAPSYSRGDGAPTLRGSHGAIHPYDFRPAHPLMPQYHRLPITKALRANAAENAFTVTLVGVANRDGNYESADLLDFSRLSVIAYS